MSSREVPSAETGAPRPDEPQQAADATTRLGDARQPSNALPQATTPALEVGAASQPPLTAATAPAGGARAPVGQEQHQQGAALQATGAATPGDAGVDDATTAPFTGAGVAASAHGYDAGGPPQPPQQQRTGWPAGLSPAPASADVTPAILTHCRPMADLPSWREFANTAGILPASCGLETDLLQLMQCLITGVRDRADVEVPALTVTAVMFTGTRLIERAALLLTDRADAGYR